MTTVCSRHSPRLMPRCSFLSPPLNLINPPALSPFVLFMSFYVLFMFRRCESETPDSLERDSTSRSRSSVDMLITFF